MSINSPQAAILAESRPGDDKGARSIHGDAGAGPVGNRDGAAVDAEIAADRISSRIETATKDAVAHACRQIESPPHHREVAAAIHGDGGLIVLLAGATVDAEFAAHAHATGIVKL